MNIQDAIRDHVYLCLLRPFEHIPVSIGTSREQPATYEFVESHGQTPVSGLRGKARYPWSRDSWSGLRESSRSFPTDKTEKNFQDVVNFCQMCLQESLSFGERADGGVRRPAIKYSPNCRRLQ